MQRGTPIEYEWGPWAAWQERNPPAATLQAVLRFEPETGFLFWRERPIEAFSDGVLTRAQQYKVWNFRHAERRAFTSRDNHGYYHGAIKKRALKAHRVIWAMHTDTWPREVDHIDGNPGNNLLSNLRAATRAQNMRNAKSARVGLRGVQQKSSGNWAASISVDGERLHLGTFQTAEAAARAYDDAARLHHGEFATLNFPTKWLQSLETQEEDA